MAALAFIILPAHASAGNVTLRSIDTFPLLDNPIPVQQAPIDYSPHFLLSWDHFMHQRYPDLDYPRPREQVSAVRKPWKLIPQSHEKWVTKLTEHAAR